MDLHDWLYHEPDIWLSSRHAVNHLIAAGLSGWQISYSLRSLRQHGSAEQFRPGSWFYSELGLESCVAEANEY